MWIKRDKRSHENPVPSEAKTVLKTIDFNKNPAVNVAVDISDYFVDAEAGANCNGVPTATSFSQSVAASNPLPLP